MKTVSLVLSIFIVLFTIVSCDSATDSGGNGQDTLIISHDDYTPSTDSSVCDKCEDGQIEPDAESGFCGDGICKIFEGDTPENCLNCFEDCPCSLGLACNDVGVCEADPLADYYWLEGQWKRESVDGNPDGWIVDVTVEGWDDDLGAEVRGFSPLNPSYIKKNADTNAFILFVDYKDGNYAKGLADQNTLTLEFDLYTEFGEIHHNIYKKL